MVFERKKAPAPPRFPEAPTEYNAQFMSDFTRAIEVAFAQLRNPGDARHSTIFVSADDSDSSATTQSPDLSPGKLQASTMTLTDLPTSSAGLNTGDLYNDSGTVKVAP